MKTVTESGFTLYELLVTLLVAGVIFTIGTPNLLELTRNNRMSATANSLVTAIDRARNEAITVRMPVTVCMAPEPLEDLPSCDADLSDPDSGGGYVSWVDDDADAVIDAGERILSQTDDPEGITVLGDSGYLQFGPNGYIQDVATAGADSASAWLLCDARGNVASSGSLSAARGLRIDPSGRTYLMREVGQIVTLGLTCPDPS
jgi:prepilin-type N-terminal cleavage/methylation domain-containing protein